MFPSFPSTFRPGVVVLILLVLLPTMAVADSEVRRFKFVYESRIGPVASGRGPVHVWIPLPRDDDAQQVVKLDVDANIDGVIEAGDEHGNRWWHGSLEVSNGEPIWVRLEAIIERRPLADASGPGAPAAPAPDPASLQRYLEANERVLVGHEILDPILAEIREKAGSQQPDRMARAIYDWVVDNVEYKKVGSGWGNGDTFWACNERYGNCTDFHALLISLARTEGIPARFEMGFPIPDGKNAGKIEGYHCWVELYLPDVGWMPVDASEAFKHPEKREMLYGGRPTDRIHFTTGRDLRLGPDHEDKALNYFVYPYVEVDRQADAVPVEKSFSYEDG